MTVQSFGSKTLRFDSRGCQHGVDMVRLVGLGTRACLMLHPSANRIKTPELTEFQTERSARILGLSWSLTLGRFWDERGRPTAAADRVALDLESSRLTFTGCGDSVVVPFGN